MIHEGQRRRFTKGRGNVTCHLHQLPSRLFIGTSALHLIIMLISHIDRLPVNVEVTSYNS